MTKSHKLVKNRHKKFNLGNKKSQASELRHETVGVGDKELQTSVKKTQKCKFK